MPHAPSATLRAEALDERIVPAAAHSLTTRGAELVADGFIARQVDAQPTGTGHIHSFVRVQGAASGGGSQQGYNTTARPLQFDENKSPQFTRGLTLGQVPVVSVGGTAYREFLLDINQKSSAPKLSLDKVQVFLGDRSDLTGYNADAKTLAGRPAVFDLDAGGDVSLILDARLNSGSGSGDMVLLIPDVNFAGAGPNTFVYLYSQMGMRAGATANGGFEEWAVRTTGGTATTGTASISGPVFVDFNMNGVRDPASGEGLADVGLAGVVITLQGVNDLGQTVVLTTTTDANGFYTFTGLRAGTYTLLEEQPLTSSLQDGADYVGTVNGVQNGRLSDPEANEGTDSLLGIVLKDDEHGVDYIFTEYFFEG